MHSNSTNTCWVLAATIALSGCVSTHPRPFVPKLSVPLAEPLAFERDFRQCADAVAAGEENFPYGGGAVALTGAIGTVAAVQTAGMAGAATAAGGSAAIAAAALGLVVAVPITTYSMSRVRRSRNESQVQAAMGQCLATHGHAISGWTRVSRGKAGAMGQTTPTTIKRQDEVPSAPEST